MKSFLITLFLIIFYFSLFSQNEKNIDWQSNIEKAQLCFKKELFSFSQFASR